MFLQLHKHDAPASGCTDTTRRRVVLVWLGTTAFDEAFHQSQSFITDMMLDAFGIDRCCVFADAQSQQESIDTFMPPLREFGEVAAFDGQSHRSVGLCINVAVSLHPRHRSVDRDMTDGEAFGKIPHSALAQIFFQLSNGFRIVLSQLGRMIAPSPLMAFGLCPQFFHCFLCRSFVVRQLISKVPKAEDAWK